MWKSSWVAQDPEISCDGNVLWDQGQNSSGPQCSHLHYGGHSSSGYYLGLLLLQPTCLQATGLEDPGTSGSASPWFNLSL